MIPEQENNIFDSGNYLFWLKLLQYKFTHYQKIENNFSFYKRCCGSETRRFADGLLVYQGQFVVF